VIGLARIGGPVACLGLALLLVATTRRERIAGLAFAAVGACVLAAALAPGRPLLILGGVFAALGLGVGLALLFQAQPWLFPVLAFACVPIRIGVHLAGSSSKLLVPLYVVILGGVLLFALELSRGDARVRELRSVSWPLAAFVAWTGLSLAWSKDVHDGAIELLAFYVPFTLLAVVVARLPWRSLGLRALYAEVTLMAVAFSIIGFYQYETRDIFQNPKVIYSNAYAPFFRVNSVFWDPSVYGRFLVVAMVPSIVAIVLWRSARVALAAAAALVVMWVGLLISFSQSSFAALIAVVVLAAFVAWRWRATIAVLLAAAVLAGIAVSQPQIRRSFEHHTSSGLNHITSGRKDLVANGVRIAAHHPVLGVGVGGFKRAYANLVHYKGKDPKKAASHDTPVTVAAESGVVGLGVFAWLLAALFSSAFRRRGAVALVAALGLAAILVHSLFYNAFFEDPMTWGLIGLVALTAPVAIRLRPPPAPPAVAEKEVVPV
jgi:putative inorganic carbon (HCO3(-)) transporter